MSDKVTRYCHGYVTDYCRSCVTDPRIAQLELQVIRYSEALSELESDNAKLSSQLATTDQMATDLEECRKERDELNTHRVLDRAEFNMRIKTEREGYSEALKKILASPNSNMKDGWLYCIKVAAKALEG